MKTLHKLRKPQKSLDKKFFVFDTETAGLRGRPDAFVFGVVRGYMYTRVIYSVEEFIEEFEKPMYNKKYVFAHNAEYDLSVLYGNIYKMDNKAIFNGKFISATNGNCLFADSLNIFPASVEKIGDLMGFPKLKIHRKFKEGAKNIKVTKKDIEYCIRDCDVVIKGLTEIFDKVGAVKITLAGLSLDFFRRSYLDFHIDFNEKLSNNFFNSYFGGRTEAFKLGDMKAVAYDINSMYPFAMLNCIFPNPKYLKELKKMPDKDLFIRHFLGRYEGVAELKVNHKENYFGFLPIRKDGKLIFPVGIFSGWWNFNEIRLALKYGMIEILEIKNITYSRKMESPFKKFVDALYTDRKNSGNELERLILKLLLNSLYGKFGQRKKSEHVYIEDIRKDYPIIDYYKAQGTLLKIKPFNSERFDMFLEVLNLSQEKIYNSIPVFSSYITSYARGMLLENLEYYKNFDPVYCDTDSIFLEYNPEIPHSDELGGWKLEEKIITNIRGLKNYSYIADGKIIDKIKGIPKKAKKVGENKYVYENLIKTREALARNIEPGILTKREKILSHRYDKRIILKNLDTLPLKLNENENT